MQFTQNNQILFLLKPSCQASICNYLCNNLKKRLINLSTNSHSQQQLAQSIDTIFNKKTHSQINLFNQNPTNQKKNNNHSFQQLLSNKLKTHHIKQQISNQIRNQLINQLINVIKKPANIKINKQTNNHQLRKHD
ncbi:hypothetical protein ABPG72_000465 [Tetrahymena utriculariae]